MKTSNKTAREQVNKRKEFKGSNTSGVWKTDNMYVVYSYGWFPLFVWITDKGWFENSTKYSKSTSKQVSQLRPSEETSKLSQKEIENLVAENMF